MNESKLTAENLLKEVERLDMNPQNPKVIIDPGTGKPLIINGVVQEDVLKKAVEKLKNTQGIEVNDYVD